MPMRRNLTHVTWAAVLGSLVIAGGVNAIAQQRESRRPDFSGRWQLNRELSENAEAKLDRMQSSRGGGSGHGPGRHGGLGGLFGGGGQMAQIEEARGLVLNAPSWFVLKHDGERIVLTDSDGRVRTLTADGRKEKVSGRDIRTKWDKDRLVSETSLGGATVTETYERSPDVPQLIVTTKMEMHGQQVTVRRVYDPVRPQ